MELRIDSSNSESLRLALYTGKKLIRRLEVPASRRQAEKLLPLLSRLTGNKPEVITRIVAESRGESFTALRIGIVTANALAFALGIPVQPVEGKAKTKRGIRVIEPHYAKGPTIHPRPV